MPASLWLLAPTPEGLRLDLVLNAKSNLWWYATEESTPIVVP